MSRKFSRKSEPELSREPVHPVANIEGVNQLAEVRDQLEVIQHQINNPLAVVLGNVQFLLLKRDQLDDKLVKRLRVIEKAALKISEMNQQLTGLTKSNSENRADGEKNGSWQVCGAVMTGSKDRKK